AVLYGLGDGVWLHCRLSCCRVSAPLLVGTSPHNSTSARNEPFGRQPSSSAPQGALASKSAVPRTLLSGGRCWPEPGTRPHSAPSAWRCSLSSRSVLVSRAAARLDAVPRSLYNL